MREKYDEETLKAYLKDKRLNPETVRKGKNPGNVWTIPRLTGNAKERVGHPTQKPVAVVERIVKAMSNPGDVVMDFFAGSGTTTRVCVEQGRHSIAADQDSKMRDYLDAHLAQIQTDMFTIPHNLLDETDWMEHPLFEERVVEEG